MGPEAQKALKSQKNPDGPTSGGATLEAPPLPGAAGLAAVVTAIAQGSSRAGGLISLFRANRKMQLLPFLKKDPRYWGLNRTVSPGCLGPRSFLCASVPKAQDQIPRRALETGRSSPLSQPARLSPPCRASAHHLQTRRGDVRREALPQPDPPRAGLSSLCLCVPATRL